MAGGPARRDWRAGAAVPVQGASSKSSSLFVAGLLAVALIGALAGLLFWLLAGGEQPVRYINIPLCEYVNPVWPPVPFAEADADRLIKHFGGQEKAFNDQEQERFTQKLASLQSIKDRPLVLHITGLAVAREDKVYLLSSKAGPGFPDNNWHLVDDVFKAMAACPSKHKLLILDVAHPLADASRSVLADAASAQLNAMLKAMAADKKLPCLVLVSAGAGEFSQPYDEERSSAFAYYMDQALAGHADGYDDSARDKWVKVREMAAYVRDHVARWAFYSRGVTQTVTLYGDSDFRLTVHEHHPQWPDRDFKPLPVPKWIVETWTIRDQWEADGARSKGGHLLRKLEDTILRAEARNRAGGSDERVQRELSVRAELAAAWDKLKAVQPPPKVSLAGTPAPTALSAKLEGWLDGFDPKRKLDDVIGEPKAKPDEKLWAIWLRLDDRPLSRDRVVAMCGEAVPPGPIPNFAEAVFMRKLGELASKPVFASERKWPEDTVNAAVKAELAMLDAFAAAGDAPEAFRWLRARFEEADTKRLEAEAILWTLGNDGLPGAATTATRIATTYKEVAVRYGEIRDEARRASQAQRAMTDAFAELPGIAAMLGQLDRKFADDAPWVQAVETTVTLADAFTQPSPPPGDLLTQQTAVLNSALTALRNKVAELVRLPPDGSVAPAILATPRLPAKEREAWWTTWRKWTAGKNQWLDENESQTRSGEAAAPGDWAGPEAERAARRARLAIGLGRLAGLSVSSLSSEANDLATRPDIGSWNNFATKLLPLFAPVNDGGMAVADRTDRAIGTADARARAYAKVRKDFWTWAVERYDREASSRGMGRLSYYLEAAGKARAAADSARAAFGS